MLLTTRHAFGLLAAGAALLVLAGCGGGSSTSGLGALSGTGRATFLVKWPQAAATTRLIPAAALSVKVVLSRNEQTLAERVLERPTDGTAAASATFANLPTGELVATATAHPESAGTGTPQARAQMPVTITAGEDTPLRLAMNSTITRVVVTPDAPVLSPQEDVTLAVSARDVDDNVVLTAPASWQSMSDNNAVATAAATPTGTGVLLRWASPGRATIRVVETESGQQAVVPVVASGYLVADLGENEAVALSANNSSIAGSAAPSGGTGPRHGALWQNAQTAPRDLGVLPGGAFSYAQSVNRGDTVAGWGNVPDPAAPGDPARAVPRAWVWHSGVLTDLGTLGGPGSSAYALNDAGQIVGWANTAGGATQRACLWQNGVATDLGTLGGSDSAATGINQAGQIVGAACVSGNRQTGVIHAFVWQGGTLTDLGTLPGSQRSGASAISDNGVIVGASHFAGASAENSHAVSWRNNQITDLGTLPGYERSYALGVSNAGEIVGIADQIGGAARAVLWKNGQIVDLNRLIAPGADWTLTKASAVSDDGRIVGSATRGGRAHAVLLTPVR